MLLIILIRGKDKGNKKMFYLLRKIRLLLDQTEYNLTHIFREGNNCCAD